MLGGTAGRTTLNGEGLQHQDGHSLINGWPSRPRRYDPAYAYETAVIVFDGLKRAARRQRDGDLLHHARPNDNYMMPEAVGVEEGIIRGMSSLLEQ